MKKVFIYACCLLFIACNGNNKNTANTEVPAAPAEFTGYQLTQISGSPLQKAIKTSESGLEVEQGTILNGQKNGAWMTFHEKERRIKSITNYIAGKKNGLHLELNDRGQVTLQCFYTNDAFDGVWTSYRFGSRKEKEVKYKMGVMDQFYREYHQNGKLLKDIQYKGGKIHGYFRQYDDKEVLLMEYQYDNGQIVSGGIIE